MALYNFQKRFAEKILSGEKRHTIRATRKRQTMPCEILHLYTGLRQKGARLLMRVPCTKVEEILIDSACHISIDGAGLDPSECDQLARCDGFLDYVDMMCFWSGRLPFRGQIIHWKFTRVNQSGESKGNGIQAAVPADGMYESNRSKAHNQEVLLGRLPAEGRAGAAQDEGSAAL